MNTDTKRYPRTLLATACIPWNEDYSLDEESFRREIGILVENDITHFYLFGTAGEGYAVSDAQFDEIVRVFADEVTGLVKSSGRELHPMVGIISLSTSTVIERIKRTHNIGITEFQISLPSWGALSESEVFSFFHTVCDAFPDCQFLHYNLPRAKRIVTPDEYARLTEEIPNLVATKNCISDTLRIYELETRAPQLRHFMGEMGFPFGCLVGEPGLLVSLVNSNFRREREFFEAGVDRDVEKLLTMQGELMEMLRELFIATDHVERIDGAYDKLFVRFYAPDFPLRLLPPYEANTEESFRRYAAVLKERFPQWLPED